MTHSITTIRHLSDCLLAIYKREHEEALLQVIKVTQSLVSADAIALLKHTPKGYQVVAQKGLSNTAVGRLYDTADHPRLAAISQSHNWTRFESDSPLPDPYDGLVPAVKGNLDVHDCMGISLEIEGYHWGIMTLDALDADAFGAINEQTLNLIGHLASLTLALNNDIELLQHPHTNAIDSLLGDSDVMLALKKQIKSLAPIDIAVLILGETGTGKELVAKALHDLSNRAQAPFIVINCATLSKELAPSELFGHVKGAFTGADKDNPGKFKAAQGGTLFLDEVGELDTDVQAQLLRVLQSGEFSAVGDERVQIADVRVIAATHRDLKQMSKEGGFREDLYFRLSVFELLLPPLAERGEDIILLAKHFAKSWSNKLGVSTTHVTESFLNSLVNRSWPGNIRELEQVVARQLLDQQHPSEPTQSTILKNDRPALPVSLNDATQQFQRQLILNALNDSQQNWSAAARALELDRANLVRLAKRIGLR